MLSALNQFYTSALTSYYIAQKILSGSNQFYTIVPQNFGAHGMSDRYLIDTEKKLLEKRELVETLLEMEIAVSLSKGIMCVCACVWGGVLSYTLLEREIAVSHHILCACVFVRVCFACVYFASLRVFVSVCVSVSLSVFVCL